MLKIGLIGCGTMGSTHSKAYKSIANAKLTQVFDIRIEKSKVVADEHGANICKNFEEMLKQEIDILDICLPTYLHAEYAISAMNAGKNVFCEKPMAISTETASQMIKVANQNNVKLSIGHVLRFFPQYDNAIKLIKQNKVGVPKLIRTIRNQALPEWSWENWYLDYEKSGGPILDLIIHDIDWCINNFGDVDYVYCQTIKERTQKDDHTQALLKLKNGMICYCEGSWALPAGSPFRMAFEIIGTEGQIEYDNTKNFANKIQKNTGNYSEINQTVFSMNEEPYCKELQLFINSVVNHTQPVVKPVEALKSLEVAFACIKSAKTGKPVFL
ncbi:Gfo/Idh/MocA family protein [Enterococcus massiliensis]|uniref:Gfo/Idh/MocA family protein n=1 Tax=Enterococcus massiliensis TaxID=1640685 RepID=UPI00065E98A6|nr:Gfo/Idh/MocA family oxidoreductase [Enterococcus massiliensis]